MISPMSTPHILHAAAEASASLPITACPIRATVDKSNGAYRARRRRWARREMIGHRKVCSAVAASAARGIILVRRHGFGAAKFHDRV